MPISRYLRTGIELFVIVIAASIVNWNMVTAPSNKRLYGHEAEWLTSSAHTAHLALRDYGYLPLWQSYHEFGEPLIDNPFSFILNPISAAPSLLFGGTVGIRVSVLLYGIFAGLGGWFLARVLRLGLLARLLLALLMITKGNMTGMIGMGFFQLGVAQAYFPWLIGAGIAVLRMPGERWHIVLLALMFTLLFWAGNIWYTLPMAFALGVLTLFQMMPGQRGTWDSGALRRMLLAGALTIGLSAVTLLPIFWNRDFIGRHTPEPEAGVAVDPLVVAPLFVADGDALFRRVEEPYYPQFYYSYVVPWWYIALALALLPPIALFRPFQRSAIPEAWRLLLPAVFLLIGAFIWGVGGNPLMIWLYDAVPGLARWRFVGRALALASFWLALLLALRADSLWRAVLARAWRKAAFPPRAVYGAQLNAAALLLVITGVALIPPMQAARGYLRTTASDPHDSACLQWLRLQYPARELAVWRYGYEVTTPFLDQRIRQADIEADYAALPMAWTLGAIDLTASLPEYAIGWYGEEGAFLVERGYQPVPDSLRSMGRSCLYRLEDALSYAYSIPLETLQAARGDTLERRLTTPIQTFQRLPDRIRVFARAAEQQPTVVTVQERAYPGWGVRVDGQPAQLESVGGQIGVILPPGSTVHEIIFEYRPPLLFIGGGLTLLTWLGCVAYLLRWDRRFRQTPKLS